MHKNSLKNLTPKSSNEARENGRVGGIKSGEARRQKKKLCDELLILLDVVDKNGKTIRENICFSLIQQALNGNIRAFETIRSSIGESPVEKIEATNTNIDITDEAVIEKVFEKIKQL